MVKTFLFILSIAAFSAHGQEDSTRYIFGLPVTEDDTAQHLSNGDLEPKNKLQIVDINRLPQKLRESLDSEDLYEGWQDTLIYFNTNTKLFIVPVRRGKSVKIFGLNENGKPVTFSEVTAGDQ